MDEVSDNKLVDRLTFEVMMLVSDLNVESSGMLIDVFAKSMLERLCSLIISGIVSVNQEAFESDKSKGIIDDDEDDDDADKRDDVFTKGRWF